MKFIHSFALIIGSLLLIEVSCDGIRYIEQGDPTDLAEGWSYERFNFLTELIVNGKNVDDKLSWNSCSNYTGIDYFLNKTESKNCLGQVINCETDSGDYHRTKRVLTLQKLVMGTLSLFTKEPKDLTKSQSCHCLCNRLYDAKPNSSTVELLDSICLDEVSTDVKNNYVVTGVRLIRLNNTIAFEIQEGQFFEGLIMGGTERWIPLPKKCNKIGLMNFSKRTLVLDDVILPEHAVVTGVAFRRYSNVLLNDQLNPESEDLLQEDPFFLSVIGHEVNSHKLQINSRFEKQAWNYSLEYRTNLINDDMEESIVLMLPHHNHKLSKPDKNYIKFGLTTPIENLRKTVIPFVDSQRVADKAYPQLARGIGLYYKGYEGYGGYIAPSLIAPTYQL